MYEVEIVDREEMSVTALVLHTTFAANKQAEEIPPFFHRVMEEETLEGVPNRLNANQICVVVRKAGSPEFDYYMGVETDGLAHVPEGMEGIIILAGKYARTAFVKRGNADVLAAFRYVTENWLPENNHAPKVTVPAFIYYDERFIPIFKEQGYAGNPVASIYVPVA
jgi:predicted transcriptional regulator YdeE